MYFVVMSGFGVAFNFFYFREKKISCEFNLREKGKSSCLAYQYLKSEFGTPGYL